MPFIEFLRQTTQWNKQVLRTQLWRIEHLEKNTDLSEPEKVFAYIKNRKGKDTYKSTFVTTYQHYAEYMNIEITSKVFLALSIVR